MSTRLRATFARALHAHVAEFSTRDAHRCTLICHRYIHAHEHLTLRRTFFLCIFFFLFRMYVHNCDHVYVCMCTHACTVHRGTAREAHARKHHRGNACARVS